MKTLTFAVALLLAAQVSWGKAGPEIPRPKQKLTEAVEIATKAFFAEKGLSQSEVEWRKDCIVLSVSYDTPYLRSIRGKTVLEAEKGERDEEWSWFVKFIHPVANDVSFTFRVMPDGTVQAFERTS